MDLRYMDRDARAYFDGLPTDVKMQIVEGSLDLTTKAQLEDYFKLAAQSAVDDNSPRQ